MVKLCWDEAKGLVADTKAKAQFSQQANILAVLAEAVPAGRRASVLDKVLAEPMLSSADGTSATLPGTPAKGLGLAKASYYFRFYLARALEATGRGDEYLPQLEPWREMLDLGLSTWAETPEPRVALRLPRLERTPQLRPADPRGRHQARLTRLQDGAHRAAPGFPRPPERGLPAPAGGRRRGLPPLRHRHRRLGHAAFRA